MTPDLVAQLLLAFYVVAPLAVVVRKALACPSGPTVWFLHLVNRLYLGFFYRCRSRPCPIPGTGPALISGQPPQPGRSVVSVVRLSLPATRRLLCVRSGL